MKEIAKKVTEEAGELSISAVTNDGRVIDEAADLMYHLLVMLRKLNLSYSDVLEELKININLDANEVEDQINKLNLRNVHIIVNF